GLVSMIPKRPGTTHSTAEYSLLSNSEQGRPWAALFTYPTPLSHHRRFLVDVAAKFEYGRTRCTVRTYSSCLGRRRLHRQPGGMVRLVRIFGLRDLLRARLFSRRQRHGPSDECGGRIRHRLSRAT